LAAFSADFVTGVKNKHAHIAKKSRLTFAARLVSFIDGLDNSNSNGLPHVTNSEATERRVLIVGLCIRKKNAS